MASRATARAPSSTANLGPGFDVFGLAIDAFHDRITLARTKKGISIVTSDDVPTGPQDNTAGLVVRHMKRRFGISGGIEIGIRKGVPAGFGMGSSAASAAAAAVAFDRLFGLDLDDDELVRCAGVGEKASAGTVHYDNVAASVLGGFVVVRTDPLRVTRMAPPPDLRMVVAVPRLEVPRKKTRVSRSVIPKRVPFADSVTNLASASAMVAGFAKRDSALIGSAARDVIVEPARKHMIPGFDDIRRNALGAGALGVTISGAGPSVIAFSTRSADLKKIGRAMQRGFSAAGTDSQVIACKPGRGASGS